MVVVVVLAKKLCHLYRATMPPLRRHRRRGIRDWYKDSAGLGRIKKRGHFVCFLFRFKRFVKRQHNMIRPQSVEKG
jgi:hypothetical protein